jgi:hypothetical protein
MGVQWLSLQMQCRCNGSSCSTQLRLPDVLVMPKLIKPVVHNPCIEIATNAEKSTFGPRGYAQIA